MICGKNLRLGKSPNVSGSPGGVSLPSGGGMLYIRTKDNLIAVGRK
jgi:hypothetical protein